MSDDYDDDGDGCLGCILIVMMGCFMLILIKFTWNYLFS